MFYNILDLFQVVMVYGTDFKLYFWMSDRIYVSCFKQAMVDGDLEYYIINGFCILPGVLL